VFLWPRLNLTQRIYLARLKVRESEFDKDQREKEMRVFPRFRSLSRAVHQEQEQEHEEEKNNAEKLSTSLTVWRKSLVMSCKGFTVIDCYGNLVYRVDNYIGRPNEVTLMDASGRSILTMFRRRVCLNYCSLYIINFLFFLFYLFIWGKVMVRFVFCWRWFIK